MLNICDGKSFDEIVCVEWYEFRYIEKSVDGNSIKEITGVDIYYRKHSCCEKHCRQLLVVGTVKWRFTKSCYNNCEAYAFVQTGF